MPADSPTFFFSHARQDRDMPGNYLLKFFVDLERRLAAADGIPLPEHALGVLPKKALGTIDVRVQHGADWDETLSAGLGSDRAFIAIYTPLYFKRENCGKELAVFLLRNPKIGIDSNGALTHVCNVLPIRWYPEGWYALQTVKDAVIPSILKLIEDTPAHELDLLENPELAAAIKRYRSKGMERCVNSEPHYTELLDRFVECIRAMQPLPAQANVSFANAHDAFKYDWTKHFAAAGVAPPSASATVPSPAPLMPGPLTSIVVFYVTARQFTTHPGAFALADQLIAEPLPGVPAQIDPQLGALLGDVRTAGAAEGFDVFHAAGNPVIPDDPTAFIGRLATVSGSGVITALLLDPAVWLNGSAANMDAVDQIIRSPDWKGPVLVAALNAETVDVDRPASLRALPPRLFALPRDSDQRIASLRRAFVDARGRTLSGASSHSPGAESLPLLKGVGSEPR